VADDLGKCWGSSRTVMSEEEEKGEEGDVR
jgi:hypothetical protein